MPEEVYIKLRFIEENLKPETITQLIGIEPTISGKKGDVTYGRKLPIEEGIWIYKYIINETPWNIGDALSDLLPLVESKPKLIQFCLNNNIFLEFSVILYLATNTPIITLEPSLLKRVAAINATIDFDIYLIPAEENPSCQV